MPEEQAPPAHFARCAGLKRRVKNSAVNINVVNVTFEPKTRTFWHSHPLGQILMVTSGNGYFQNKKRLLQKLQPGYIVIISPGKEHWHGAAEDNEPVHIAVNPKSETSDDVTWFEEVMEPFVQVPFY